MARRTSAAFAMARRIARQEALEQRARLAGLDITITGGNKFHRVKTTYNGETYDSMGEAEYAQKLDAAVAAGKIVDWWRPGAMTLVDAERLRDRITYRPDFAINPIEGPVYYVDYKGSTVNKNGKRHTPTETEAFRMRVKLWKRTFPTVELRVVYSDGTEKVVANPVAAAVAP